MRFAHYNRWFYITIVIARGHVSLIAGSTREYADEPSPADAI